MTFTPTGTTADAAHAQVARAWSGSYDPEATRSTISWLERMPLSDRLIHLFARLAFRGIYFPQMKWSAWARVVLDNRGTIGGLLVAAGMLDGSAGSSTAGADLGLGGDQQQAPQT